jgi:hypothetical protein
MGRFSLHFECVIFAVESLPALRLENRPSHPISEGAFGAKNKNYAALAGTPVFPAKARIKWCFPWQTQPAVLRSWANLLLRNEIVSSLQ